MTDSMAIDRVLTEVEAGRDELLAFTASLIRIPTVNPPGECYRDCAELIGERLSGSGLDVEFVEAQNRPEHTTEHPRVNVIGRLEGMASRPCIHLNGHFDVVPPGDGWKLDPFGGEVRDGRIYGRGASDMKSGIAAAAFAVEAIQRSGISLSGSVEVSGTVDEESGGYAGVAHLCKEGYLATERTDYVVIPEPFGPDRICVGHRGVYWFDVIAEGRVAHGSMPHLGQNAISDMGVLLYEIRTRLEPELASRISVMPVVPEEARHPSINVNAVWGGQVSEDQQSPCVADCCVVTFDRRFIPEESLEEVRREVAQVVAAVEQGNAGCSFSIEERMSVLPTQAPQDSPLISALSEAIRKVQGSEAELVASPGTYDQKHVSRIAGVDHCVAYGPGPLEEAHQPDESCSVDDIVTSAQVMALTVLELVG